jgi:hypothetical protein
MGRDAVYHVCTTQNQGLKGSMAPSGAEVQGLRAPNGAEVQGFRLSKRLVLPKIRI